MLARSLSMCRERAAMLSCCVFVLLLYSPACGVACGVAPCVFAAMYS